MGREDFAARSRRFEELRAADFLVFGLQIRWETTTSKRFAVAVDFL
jgi:hypothetical protein